MPVGVREHDRAFGCPPSVQENSSVLLCNLLKNIFPFKLGPATVSVLCGFIFSSARSVIGPQVSEA